MRQFKKNNLEHFTVASFTVSKEKSPASVLKIKIKTIQKNKRTLNI